MAVWVIFQFFFSGPNPECGILFLLYSFQFPSLRGFHILYHPVKIGTLRTPEPP